MIEVEKVFVAHFTGVIYGYFTKVHFSKVKFVLLTTIHIVKFHMFLSQQC